VPLKSYICFYFFGLEIFFLLATSSHFPYSVSCIVLDRNKCNLNKKLLHSNMVVGNGNLQGACPECGVTFMH
jgi:hypothetical protein